MRYHLFMISLTVLFVVAQSTPADAYQQALDFIDQGEYQDAKRMLLKAIAQNPDSSYLHEALAEVYFNMSELDSSLIEYKRAFELDPQNANAAYNTAYIYQQWEEFDSAEVYYRKAIDLDPSDPGTYLNLGNVLWDSGDMESAEKEYKKALEVEPSYYNAHFNLALLYQHQGEDSLAEAHYLKAIEYAEDDFDARWNLSLLYEDMGRYEDAISFLEVLADEYPDDPDVLFELARMYEAMDRVQDAEDTYRKLIELEPDYGEAYYRMAVLLGAAADETSESDQWSEEDLASLMSGSEEMPAFWGVGASYDSRYYQNSEYREEKITTDIPAFELYGWWGKYIGTTMATYITVGANYPIAKDSLAAVYDSLDNYDLSWEMLRYFDNLTLDFELKTRLYPKYIFAGERYNYARLVGGAYIFPPFLPDGVDIDVFMGWDPSKPYLNKAFWGETDISGEMHHGEFKSSADFWQRWDTFSDKRGTGSFDLDAASLSYRFSYHKWGFSASVGVGYYWLIDRKQNDPENGPYYTFSMSYSR